VRREVRGQEQIIALVGSRRELSV